MDRVKRAPIAQKLVSGDNATLDKKPFLGAGKAGERGTLTATRLIRAKVSFTGSPPEQFDAGTLGVGDNLGGKLSVGNQYAAVEGRCTEDRRRMSRNGSLRKRDFQVGLVSGSL